MAIGVDIGGTGLRAARLSRMKAGVQKTCRSTDRSVEGVLSALIEVVQDLGPGPVGLAVPGFIEQGVVLASPNFPTWHDVPFAALAQERLKREVTIANDADCAALGASVHLQVPNLVALTLGTGVGGGIIVDGHPLEARTGGELGHIWIGGEERCGCGALGCLETHASVPAVLRRATQLGLAPDLSALFAIDAPEHPVWHELNEALAHALRTFSSTLGPQAIALMGGLVGPHLKPALQAFRQQALPHHRDLPVHLLGRADAYAIVGAATLTDR